MYRGCRKNIIHIKNTGSRYIEQAYFILKDDLRDDEERCSDMISEANRIVEASVNRKQKRSVKARSLLPFALGAVLSTLLYTAALLILGR